MRRDGECDTDERGGRYGGDKSGGEVLEKKLLKRKQWWADP